MRLTPALVYSVGLDRCIMSCIYHYHIAHSIFSAQKKKNVAFEVSV